MTTPTLGRAAPHIAPTDIDKAYAAGFFDGEGFVTIAFMSSKTRALGKCYTMRVGASQNHVEPLLFLRDRWGGSVRALKRQTAAGNTPMKWDCCSRMAAQFLRDVRPFLIVKADRADIAIAFQDSLFIPGKSGHTVAYRDRLEQMRIAMTGLNTHKHHGYRRERAALS